MGKEVVRLLAPYGCRILANDIVEQAGYFAENGLIAASKEEIRAEADFVTIHTPLTGETRGMVDEAFLAAMKPEAYLVNTARGGIVDQAALKRALTDGAIAGAALDVFEEEPCGDLEFLSLPNLFFDAPYRGLGRGVDPRDGPQRHPPLVQVFSVGKGGGLKFPLPLL